MNYRESLSPSQQENHTSHRQLVRRGGRMVIAGAAVVGAAAMARGYFNSEAERWRANEAEREETGGYVIREIGPNLREIELLDSGKLARSDPWFSYGDDIRALTLGNALSELSESCEIEAIIELIEESGFGAATSGLVVQVRACQ